MTLEVKTVDPSLAEEANITLENGPFYYSVAFTAKRCLQSVEPSWRGSLTSQCLHEAFSLHGLCSMFLFLLNFSLNILGYVIVPDYF